jgi:hypothetical protein
MIKLFRNIRKNLLNEGKTTKYFKYAIGEIILVVIGILIALWINNWNNNRLANYQTADLLKSIKEDLVSDTIAFNESIERYEEMIDKKKKLMSLSKFEDTESDSLINMILNNHSLYDINNTTFLKVTNLGITKLSKSDSLSNKIYNYYNKELKSFSEFMTWEKESTTSEGNYWLRNQNEFEFSSEFPKFQDSIIARQNLLKLITEPKGRNQILSDYYRKKRVLNKYEQTKKIASNLITDILLDLNTN